MKRLFASLLALATIFAIAPSVHADSYTENFEGFTIGNINGQFGWQKTGAFDVSIVDPGSSFLSFNTRSLRISDAITSGSFGDQTFAKPLTDSVGESSSTNGTFDPGVKQNHFETQFEIASTSSEVQTGLHMSFSPDRGDGSRMSYLRFEDVVGGINVYFDDVQGTVAQGVEGCATPICANFIDTKISTLSRISPHTIKLTLDVVDGPTNDIVKVWIDGDLVKTGTSWEDYYRFDTEASAEQSPRIVKTVLFRESGTANLNNSGNGFLIDNLSLKSSTSPTSSTVHIFKYIGNDQATVENAGGVNFPMFTSTFNAPFTLGPTGWTSGDIAYEASTSPMNIGASYSAEESLTTSLVGATCDGVHQYALAGYSVGDTKEEAIAGSVTSTTPAFTDLQGDKYIIVHNAKCETAPPIKVHILKYLDGLEAMNVPNNYLFPMTATWSATNIGAGTGTYVLGVSFGNSLHVYGADTSEMSVPADYSTSEITSNIDVTSKVLPVNVACIPGMYKLQGYKVSDTSFVDAWSHDLETTAPSFTGLTSDKYVIVSNTSCLDHPTAQDQCKNNGWKSFTNPKFKNQGECISFVNHTEVKGKDDDHAKLIRQYADEAIALLNTTLAKLGKNR